MSSEEVSERPMDPTYWEYIRLDQLLGLQGGVDGEGDVASAEELHFIVIHQAIELLFKLVLRELRETRRSLAQPRLEEPKIPSVAQHLERVNQALGVTVAHFSFMETLGTQGFLSFREKLGSSSGAQSFQMRELEALLGLPLSERQRVLRRLRAELAHPEAVRGFDRFILDPLGAITERLRTQIADKEARGLDPQPDRDVYRYVEEAQADIREHGTLRSSLASWLFRTPICGSSPAEASPARTAETGPDRGTVRRFVEDYVSRGRASGWSHDQASGVLEFLRGSPSSPLSWFEERVRAALLFIEVYSDLPLLAWPRLVLDRLVELEARLVAFRNGHARMVERVVGDRPGTGGSAGIKYLDLTRDERVFPELVQIRGVLIPRHRRWDFPGIDEYHFARL